MRNAHFKWSSMAQISAGTSGNLYWSSSCPSGRSGALPSPPPCPAPEEPRWPCQRGSSGLVRKALLQPFPSEENNFCKLLGEMDLPWAEQVLPWQPGCWAAAAAAAQQRFWVKTLLTLERAGGERGFFAGMEGKWVYTQLLECLDEKVPCGFRFE